MTMLVKRAENLLYVSFNNLCDIFITNLKIVPKGTLMD